MSNYDTDSQMTVCKMRTIARVRVMKSRWETKYRSMRFTQK